MHLQNKEKNTKNAWFLYLIERTEIDEDEDIYKNQLLCIFHL